MKTYAPIFNWITVRNLPILSLYLGLSTAQVDYVSVFTQSSIEEEAYVEMPRGHKEVVRVLKLNTYLYNLRQIPKN